MVLKIQIKQQVKFTKGGKQNPISQFGQHEGIISRCLRILKVNGEINP